MELKNNNNNNNSLIVYFQAFDVLLTSLGSCSSLLTLMLIKKERCNPVSNFLNNFLTFTTDPHIQIIAAEFHFSKNGFIQSQSESYDGQASKT